MVNVHQQACSLEPRSIPVPLEFPFCDCDEFSKKTSMERYIESIRTKLILWKEVLRIGCSTLSMDGRICER
jgi:hypothetical protein